MRVFLSYSTSDWTLAERLVKALEAQSPRIDVYFAPHRNKSGAYWIPVLGQQLGAADAVLLLVGQRIGPWQELEYYEALRLWRNTGKPRIIPVIVAETVPGLHFLDHFHSLFLEDGAFTRVLDGVIAALDGGPSAEKPPAWGATNPYRGLNAMGADAAAFFFGREALSASILEAIRATPNRVFALVGNSGVGKSSVARAGVLASLRSRLWPGDPDRGWPVELADSPSWLAIDSVPGEHPLHALVRRFTDLWLDSPAESMQEALGWIDLLESGRTNLGRLAEAAARKIGEGGGAPPPARFILYIDQAEELYSRSLPAEARLFSRLIADAAGRPEFVVITSIRADWYGHFQADEPLFAASLRVDVQPMNWAEVERVVREPAIRLGARFEDPAIIPRIAEGVVRETGSLPMLSYLMEDAWKAMQADAPPTGIIRFPFDIVDVSRPLAARAEQFLETHAAHRDLIRQLFTLRLVHVPMEGNALRRRAWQHECPPAEWQLAHELTTKDWRLLTSGEEGGRAYIQVAHEKLIENWPSLSEWIKKKRDFLAFKGQLEIARREWQAADEGEKDRALLMGLALKRARDWAADGQIDDLGPDDRTYIEASIDHDDAQQRAAKRIRRYVTHGGIAALVALALFGLFAGYQWYEAEGARAEAVKQRDKAEQSYQTALQATDTFFSGLTDNFSDSAALPAAKVKAVLSSGQDFLANMEARMGASAALEAVRAKVLVRFAEISVEDDLSSAREQLAAARAALAALGPDDPDAPWRRAAILTLESRIALDELNHNRADELATTAVEVATTQPAASIEARIILGKAYWQKGRALWRLKRHEEAVRVSDACLASIDNAEQRQDHRVQFLLATCLHIKAINISDGKVGDYDAQARDIYDKERRILKAIIDQDSTNIGYRVSLATVENNLAGLDDAKKNLAGLDDAKKNLEASLRRLNNARAILKEARNIAPWSAKATEMLAHASRWAAATHVTISKKQSAESRLESQRQAFDLYREAADLYKVMVAENPANMLWRDSYQRTLASARDNINDMGRDGLSPAQKEYAVSALRDHIALLEQPIPSELEEDYAKWALLETRFRLAEALKWTGRIIDAADAHRAVMGETNAAAGTDVGDRRLRFWASWSHWNYPKCDMFLSLDLPLREKIARCEEALSRRERYLAKEDHWGVRAVVAQDRHVLGMLQFATGNNDAALANVRYAASRNVEAAIKTLNGWYKAGDGPVATDLENAATWEARLSKDDFSMKRFTVPLLLWDGVTKFGMDFYIRNPTEFDMDPVAQEIHRLEVIEGFKIQDDVKDSFRKLLKIAVENNVKFTELAVYALSIAQSEKMSEPQDALKRSLNAFLENRDAAGLINATKPYLEDDKGRRTLDLALADLAKPPERNMLNREGVSYLAECWQGVYIVGGYELAERIATAFINGIPKAADRKSWIHRRGLARIGRGDYDSAIADLTTLVALFPEWSPGLMSLTSAYLAAGRESDLALDLATRAMRSAPGDIFIKDMVGFAQIRTGNLDAGIATLTGVLAVNDLWPEPWAHLAEGYRRARRFELAHDALRRARRLAGNGNQPLLAYIAEQERLIESNLTSVSKGR